MRNHKIRGVKKCFTASFVWKQFPKPQGYFTNCKLLGVRILNDTNKKGIAAWRKALYNATK